jgi:hypothetical protein
MESLADAKSRRLGKMEQKMDNTNDNFCWWCDRLIKANIFCILGQA